MNNFYKNTITTTYKDTVSMEAEAAKNYMENGQQLVVVDSSGKQIGHIDPETFRNTAKYRTTRDGTRILVAEFIKTTGQ